MGLKAEVCKQNELTPGNMLGTHVGPVPVVVIRTPDGELHGLVDKCLHQGGTLSKGKLTGLYDARPGAVGEYEVRREGEILRCPWHGFEYDVRTGATLFDATRCLRKVTVWEEEGIVMAEM